MKAWLLQKLDVMDAIIGENAGKSVTAAFVVGVLVGMIFL